MERGEKSDSQGSRNCPQIILRISDHVNLAAKQFCWDCAVCRHTRSTNCQLSRYLDKIIIIINNNNNNTPKISNVP